MSEKLTVAELLARNGRESADSTTSRPRRRRRNLEEGGVSVAELTGSIPVVTQQDVDEEKARQAKAEEKPQGKAEEKPQGKAEEKPQEKAEEKLSAKKVSRKEEKPGEITGEMKTVPAAAAREEETALVSKTEPETMVAEAPAHSASDEFAVLEASLGDDEVIEYEDNTISWPMMIAQALGAIVAGVGVFYGFSLLWGNLSPIIVALMALAVTLLLVGLVHALLRHNDKLLMILAFVVGIVLTFGPRLIIGL